MDKTIVVIGANGSVWRLKIEPALHKLRNSLADQDVVLHFWGVEREGCQNNDVIIERWFSIDSPKDVESLHNALGNEEIQIAVIASPNETHVGYLGLLLGKVPHILVEKPLAEHTLEADLAVGLAAGTSKSTCMGLDHYVAKPAIRFALNKTRSGELGKMIGEIASIQFTMMELGIIDTARTSTLDRGLTFDMAIHGFTILLCWLLGTRRGGRIRVSDAHAAQYVGSPIQGETAARIDLRVKNGPSASIIIGKGLLDRKRLVIQGSEGTIEADITTGAVILRKDKEETEILPATRDDAYEVLIEEVTRAACGLPQGENTGLIELSVARDALSLVSKTRRAFHEFEKHPAGTIPRALARRQDFGSAKIEIYQDQAMLERAALCVILVTAQDAIDRHGNFVFVIPGGTSFLGVSRLLVEDAFASVDLSKWQIFFSDEHSSVHSSPINNYHLAFERGGWSELLREGRISRDSLHRIKTEGAKEKLNSDELRNQINTYVETYLTALKGRPGADLVMLGLGVDCHTSSLLPLRKEQGSVLLHSDMPIEVVEYSVETAGDDRLRASITATGIAAAKNAIILAFGANKSVAIQDILTAEIDLAARPGSILREVGGTLMTDEAGAALVKL